MSKNARLEAVKQALRKPYKTKSGHPLGLKAHDGYMCHKCVRGNFRAIVADILTGAGAWNVYPQEIWYGDPCCVFCDGSAIPDKTQNVEEVLANLQAYWKKHPYLRLAQILSNAWRKHPNYVTNPDPGVIQDIFYFTDANFLEGLELLIQDESKDQRSSEA